MIERIERVEPMPVSDDRCRRCGSALYLDDVTEPGAPMWLDGDGEYATCGDGDPHIPLRW